MPARSAGAMGMQWFIKGNAFEAWQSRGKFSVSVQGSVDGNPIRAYLSGEDAERFRDEVVQATPEGVAVAHAGHVITASGTLRRSNAGVDYIEASSLVLLKGAALELWKFREEAAEVLKLLPSASIDPRALALLERLAAPSGSVRMLDLSKEIDGVQEDTVPTSTANLEQSSVPTSEPEPEVEATVGLEAIPEVSTEVVQPEPVLEVASAEPEVKVAGVDASTPAEETAEQTTEREPAEQEETVEEVEEPAAESSTTEHVQQASDEHLVDSSLIPADALDDVDIDALVTGEQEGAVDSTPAPASTAAAPGDTAVIGDLEVIPRFGVRPQAFRDGFPQAQPFVAAEEAIADVRAAAEPKTAETQPAAAKVEPEPDKPVLAALGRAIPVVAAPKPMPAFMRRK